MIRLPARDGETVEITRSGALVDVHVRDREGQTVATVVRPAGDPLIAKILHGHAAYARLTNFPA
ncbi:hypothetical protein [Streptomyces erythrochromogenes]|uniref:hypothetical protein n=1 Tax=Streptomyces erythrochromogenes TaxID=285574 RepID=UPI00344AAD18